MERSTGGVMSQQQKAGGELTTWWSRPHSRFPTDRGHHLDQRSVNLGQKSDFANPRESKRPDTDRLQHMPPSQLLEREQVVRPIRLAPCQQTDQRAVRRKCGARS